MIKVMTVFGTRPEGIKMAPVIKALENDDTVTPVTVVTGQHQEMLQPILIFLMLSWIMIGNWSLSKVWLLKRAKFCLGWMTF